MEKRYACFELITKCHSCGNPVPVTGPFKKITCPSCFKPVHIPTDTFTDFFNEFDEEHSGFDRGQGSGGTMMGGGGTFDYSYWLLEPRCPACKKKLPEHGNAEEGNFDCPSCGKNYYVFPASDEIKEMSPSATQFITFEMPESDKKQETVKADGSDAKPVVMSCPKCGGALSVTQASERIMACQYCSTEVYIPDAIWQRLHPVKEKVEWFVRMEGKTVKQLAADRRRRDLIEEKAEIAKRKTKRKLSFKKRKPIVRYLIIGIPSFIAALILLMFLMSLFNYTQEQINNTLSIIMTVVAISVFVFVTAAGALHAFWGFWFGMQGKCKKAMDALALKHGWKYEGMNYTASIGYINAKYKGRDIEINPGDDYAIEIRIEDSPFFLKTETPAYPNDDFYRFTTGDGRFDKLFPIRYAEPKIARKIEYSDAFRTQLLKPFLWFLDRWEDQLAVAKLDWSEFAVHLYPGSNKTDFSAGKYLLPDQIEPLTEDMVTFAEALEDVLRGKEPKLEFIR